jgi:hypothetical protein
MKKSSLILAALLAASMPLSAQHLDGAYLASESYGAAGDPVKAEVVDQIADYQDAKEQAEAIQSGEARGDLRAAQRKCVDTALYSWVQANYLAEMGRVSALAGNKEQAIADYQEAGRAAKTAAEVNCHEAAKTAKSKEQAAIIAKVIKRALKRLGVE